MTPTKTKDDDTTSKDVIAICGKVLESHAEMMKMLTASLSQNADAMRLVREQNEILRKSNERMETFLFMGDPAKGVPSFVSEVRDSLGDHGGTIKRAQEALSRAVWIVVTLLITAAVGAVMWWKPVP